MTSKYTAYNNTSVPNAKQLRKSMTKEEKHLWYDFLREYPEKIYRQRPIGKYIADFYCSAAKLAIELDGGQHYSDEGMEYDEARTKAIGEYGVEVIRFTNLDIKNNFKGVCVSIDEKIKERKREIGR